MDFYEKSSNPKNNAAITAANKKLLFICKPILYKVLLNML